MTTMLPRTKNFDRVVFFTGAGISAESGVPTYRGRGGIWKDYDYADVACQQAFERNPSKVWGFHNYRRRLVSQCEPNEGHAAIAQLQGQHPRVAVITQNIDGLHQRAGSVKVVELHGSLWRVRCDLCGATELDAREERTELHCTCSAWWRPAITWFGDCLDEAVIDEATAAIRNCDLLVSVGTSAVVYPAARFPLLAKENGAMLIEINPEATPISSLFDLCVREPASAVLPRLCNTSDG